MMNAMKIRPILVMSFALLMLALAGPISVRAAEGDPMQPYGRGYPDYTGGRYTLIPNRLPAMADISAPVVVGESPNNEASLLVMPDGTMRCYYSGNGSTLYLESADGGLTWGRPQLEFTFEKAHHYPRQMLIDSQGSQHCLLFDSDTNVYHTVKPADGEWSTPVQITPGRIGAIRNLVELASGRLIYAYHRHNGPTRPPTGACFSTAIYSDDRGQTWIQSAAQVTAPVYNGFNGNNYGAVEPTIVQLNDGRVWSTMRTQTGWQYQSVSDDEGTTWADAVPSYFVSSNSPADLSRLADGRLLMVWCNCKETAPEVFGRIYTDRQALHAAVSDDEGKTWSGFREIYRDPARESYADIARGDAGVSYPRTTQNQDGKIVFCAGQYTGMRAIGLFDPDWLSQTTQSCDFSNGETDLETWHLYTFLNRNIHPLRRRGPELARHRGATGGRMLRFRRVDEHHGDAGVWNFPMGRSGEIRLSVIVERGSAPLSIALTDHHRAPNDPTAEDDAIVRFTAGIGGQIDLRPGWHTLVVRWDLDEQTASVTPDGARARGRGPQATDLPLIRETQTGMSYLRLRSLAEAGTRPAVALDAVSVEVSDTKSLVNELLE